MLSIPPFACAALFVCIHINQVAVSVPVRFKYRGKYFTGGIFICAVCAFFYFALFVYYQPSILIYKASVGGIKVSLFVFKKILSFVIAGFVHIQC